MAARGSEDDETNGYETHRGVTPTRDDASFTIDERGETLVRSSQARQGWLVRLLDCCRPLLPSSRHRLCDVRRVSIGRGPDRVDRTVVDGERVLRLEVRDPRISGDHAVLRPLPHGWVIEDLRSKNGTFVGGRPVERATLADGDVIQLGRTFFLFRQTTVPVGDHPLDDMAPPPPICGISTFHAATARGLAALESIARSNVSVVVHGETGTGKEVLAQSLHRASGQAGHFVAVNCGALPESLVESELFGVRRGAYSDAREDRLGVVRTAQGGTLFLDEIGDLRLPPQAAFLRVLQEREVTPLGQARPVPVEFRLVTATHRRLDEMVAKGTFREDLWARISGFTLHLPALRDRPEDMGQLISAMVRRFAHDPTTVTFEPSAVRLLLQHRWPQNVRELEKRLGTALAQVPAAKIESEHLGDLEHLVRNAQTAQPRSPELDVLPPARLTSLLEEHGGNITKVARALGKDRTQIRRWMRKLGLDQANHRS